MLSMLSKISEKEHGGSSRRIGKNTTILRMVNNCLLKDANSESDPWTMEDQMLMVSSDGLHQKVEIDNLLLKEIMIELHGSHSLFKRMDLTLLVELANNGKSGTNLVLKITPEILRNAELKKLSSRLQQQSLILPSTRFHLVHHSKNVDNPFKTTALEPLLK